jgi:hypothetical protein
MEWSEVCAWLHYSTVPLPVGLLIVATWWQLLLVRPFAVVMATSSRLGSSVHRAGSRFYCLYYVWLSIVPLPLP